MSTKLIGAIAVTSLLTLGLIVGGSSIVETNKIENYQIKQAAGTGTISVRNAPGMYLQGFGAIHTYKVSDENYFSTKESYGGSGAEAKPIEVRFNDGATGDISGMVKFRMPSNEEQQVLIHKEFGSYDNMKNSLIRPVIEEAIKTTATYFSAESTYTTGRVEFSALVGAQIRDGLYETITEKVVGGEGGESDFINIVTSVKKDKEGNAIIMKDSPLTRYGIEIIQVAIEDADPDDTVKALIAKKKEAEQQKVVAKANAEKAKQDAITEREQGKAKVATAEADALILKKTAVINAEKEREVAEENALKAKAEGEAIVFKGKAEADAAKLKVSAGLTPQEEAEWAYKTTVGMEEARAKFQPAPNAKMVVITTGTSSKNGSDENALISALGLKSYTDVYKNMQTTTK